MDTTLFPQDLFREKDNINFEFSTISFMEMVNQLEEFLTQVFNWLHLFSLELGQDTKFFPRGGFDSRFIRIGLVKSPISYIRKRNNPPDSGLISADFRWHSSTRLDKNHGTIRMFRNKESQSLLIYIISNCFRIGNVHNNKSWTIFFVKIYWIAKKEPYLNSGSVLICSKGFCIIRSAKALFGYSGAKVHGIIEKFFTKVGYISYIYYMKNRDPVLEVRSIDSISLNLEKRIRGWNRCITRILGIPWGFLIGAELTIVQSRISLVHKIHKVYSIPGGADS
ncbi:hypothetical protein HID58_095634 [Brassica napus]|uniref:Maturase K n=1 Tax=Brassica napus TaxID=3708 RepID=A0ABQ7X307_BRANA|nr:hypothetical protein HID58_095634 [Brassica napus]